MYAPPCQEQGPRLRRRTARIIAPEMVARLGLVSALVLVVASLTRAEAALRVRIVFHVADTESGPAADPAFLDAQFEHARQIYGPLEVALEAASGAALPARHARLVSRGDRDALAAFVEPGAIHCMVVATLMDVDEPGRERRGVHWRPRSAPARHFVIVSAISGPWVLAHELGHFFGNRAHSEVPGNLMSYAIGSGMPSLDATQSETVRRTSLRMHERGEL
jgi:hypothetical protein